MPLREVALIRLIASFGAGGVLYLTPLVFHLEAFTATSVTEGLALAALAGTLGRFVSGALLDRGLRCSVPVLLAALAAVGGDLNLVAANSPGPYVVGQLLLGIAMGLYWPAMELAVPLTAGELGSARGFALVRTGDALGIASGALLGALLASVGLLRGIYVVDLVCLVTVVALLLWRPLPGSPSREPSVPAQPWQQWVPPLVPVLLVSLVATAVPALMQSALPLDLVRGGLQRAPRAEGLGALLIGLQLGLLVLLQWPVGRWLADRPVTVGLGLSLVCFVVGSLLLALSSFIPSAGLAMVVLAQLPLALGEAAFLPTATEAIVELSPPQHQGLAMALFSQCFALSGLAAPLLAGRLLDGQGHGVGVWTLMAAAAGLALLVVQRIDRIQRRNLLGVLSGPAGSGSGVPKILYRINPKGRRG